MIHTTRHHIRVFIVAIALAALVLLAMTMTTAQAAEPGWKSAQVTGITDADTIEVEVMLQPDKKPGEGVFSRYTARIAGIEAPEPHAWRGNKPVPVCEQEAGHDATAWARGYLIEGDTGNTVFLVREQGRGAYGRMIIDLTVDSVDYAAAIVEAGHARQYKTPWTPWCTDATASE